MLPRTRVIELFDDPEIMRRWMAGLQSFEPLSGVPGTPGATSKLVFRIGKRNLEMIETITTRNLPDEFSGTCDAPGVFNVVQNRFTEMGPNRTRWESENEFRFKGFMRIPGLLMRGALSKQSLKYMQDFKAYAEEGRDVRNPG